MRAWNSSQISIIGTERKKQCCDGGPAKSEAEENYHGDLVRLNVRSVHPKLRLLSECPGFNVEQPLCETLYKENNINDLPPCFLLTKHFGDSV